MILAPGPLLTPKQKKTPKAPFNYPANQSPRYSHSSIIRQHNVEEICFHVVHFVEFQQGQVVLLISHVCAVYSVSLCSRHESYLAKATSIPDVEDLSMMGRFVRVERQVRRRNPRDAL